MQLAALRAALEAAKPFQGATAPNPPVGACAFDQAGRLLGSAAHQRAGTAHAEASLISQLRERGILPLAHTLVVSLEPCNHRGRTGPCTEAILGTSIQRVIYLAPDPNPRVPGGGAARLSSSGLEVRGPAELRSEGLPGIEELLSEAQSLIAPFAKWSRTGLPYVTLKRALNAQGSMIPEPGRKTFTREQSLDLAHSLRKRSDAILTGSGTILADQPGFDVRRVADHPEKTRILAILDRRNRVEADYVAAAKTRGLEVWIRGDLELALRELGERGCLEVLIEAGPSLTEEILRLGLWDEDVLIRSEADGDRVEVRARG